MAVHEARHAAVRLPPAPDSVSSARTLARRTLDGWGLDHLVDTAALLVSELATNVLLHARTPFELQVHHRGDRVRVVVQDGSAGAPVRRRYGLDAGTGRGLGLVETLTSDWGTQAASGAWRKAVWFELPTDPALQPGSDEGALYGDDWLALVDDL
jgi:anti-sigma regulatory factor (Ser/Thr protein kinase)